MAKKILEVIVKILTNIIVVLLSIAIFFMIYSFISINIMKNEFVNFFGYTMFEVGSGSMAPAINYNDIIIVKVDADFKVKDIITYRRDNEFITHRVIGIDDVTGLLTTMGDANNSPDLNVLPDTVIGKVAKIIPNGAIWRKIIMEPMVMFIMFITLILFNFTFSYNKPDDDKPKKKFHIPIKIKRREKQAFRN